MITIIIWITLLVGDGGCKSVQSTIDVNSVGEAQSIIDQIYRMDYGSVRCSDGVLMRSVNVGVILTEKGGEY